MKYFMRDTLKPVPDHLELYLNHLQMLGLCQAEEYGWHLEFVRRPPFHDTEAVITQNDEETANDRGVLQQDGTININADICIRH